MTHRAFKSDHSTSATSLDGTELGERGALPRLVASKLTDSSHGRFSVSLPIDSLARPSDMLSDNPNSTHSNPLRNLFDELSELDLDEQQRRLAGLTLRDEERQLLAQMLVCDRDCSGLESQHHHVLAPDLTRRVLLRVCKMLLANAAILDEAVEQVSRRLTDEL